MNGSARAIDINNVYMHVGVITYSITCTLTSFVISMCIYYIVTNEVTLTVRQYVRAGGCGRVSGVCFVCEYSLQRVGEFNQRYARSRCQDGGNGHTSQD